MSRLMTYANPVHTRTEARAQQDAAYAAATRQTEEARTNEAAVAAVSLHTSEQNRAAALALACEVHGAEPGGYCFGSGRSARGICAARYGRGVAEVAGAAARRWSSALPAGTRPASDPARFVDELAERAQAIRYAGHDARARELEGPRASRNEVPR